MNETQDTLALTACQRCRDHKIRCSRERPECAKCARLALSCVYPDPPDRRLIAARRSRPSPRPLIGQKRAQDTEKGPLRRPRQRYRGTGTDREEAISFWTPSPTPIHGASLHEPSTETKKMLQDSYFLCVFNSSLTFYRPDFERDVQQGTIPEHTLLAMHALGARFVTAPGGRSRTYPCVADTSMLRAAAKTWALLAGRLALENIDQPTLSMIQTCQILSLYWFSEGDSRRNTMFSGIGYRAVRTIVTESRETLVSTGVLPKTSDGLHKTQSATERLRRLFWASWITNVINSDHYIPGSAAFDTLVLKMPLPSGNESNQMERGDPAETLAQSHEKLKDAVAGPKETSESSNTIAELVKGLWLWARIRDHIDKRRNFPQTEPWSNAFRLQSELSAWESQLPPELIYSRRNLYHQLAVRQNQVYAMLHALCQQCYLVLHSSFIPHFSGITLEPDIPREVLQINASIALKSAKALSDLSGDLDALEWDASQVAPFVGYCMYVAGSVHISVLSSANHSEESDREKLNKCIKLLNSMKPYWTVLDRLSGRLQRLLDSQASAAITQGAYSSCDSDDEEQHELISPRQDASTLEEPLENSVLHYTLGKLKKEPEPEIDLNALEAVPNPTGRPITADERLFNGDDAISGAILPGDEGRQYSHMPLDQSSVRMSSDPTGLLIPPPPDLSNGIFQAVMDEQRTEVEGLEAIDVWSQARTALTPLFNTDYMGEEGTFRIDGDSAPSSVQAQQ